MASCLACGACCIGCEACKCATCITKNTLSSATDSAKAVLSKSFWMRVCRGEAGIWLNALCCTPVLLYKSIELYIVPTTIVVLNRLAGCIHACVWMDGMCGKFEFTDETFEGARALGPELAAKFPDAEWVRAKDLIRDPASGTPFEQDMTPTRAAGVLAYTFSACCAVYMAVTKVYNIDNFSDASPPPPPPLISTAPSPPHPSK